MILSEAFRELDILNEETFSLDKEGIEELDEFEKDDTFEDVEDVIDPNAETEDDLQDSYVGKVILDCCICHSKQYKDKEDVILNEDQTLANTEEECPFCYSTDGFKVIGQVANFDEEKEEESDEQEDITISTEKDIKEAKSIKEAIENLSMDTNDTHMEMTSDDSGKVTITTEPRRDTSDEEMIEPLDDETKAEIEMNSEESNASEDDEIDVEVDEFEEESFDELGESYLKKIYGNVKSFKTTNVSSTKDKLIIEGLIKFNSGKSKNTTFIFESKIMTKNGKVKFLGENKEITKGKKAFIIKGSIQNKKLITESLTYNYRVKNKDNKTSRLYGTVKTQKRG